MVQTGPWKNPLCVPQKQFLWPLLQMSSPNLVSKNKIIYEKDLYNFCHFQLMSICGNKVFLTIVCLMMMSLSS